MTWTWYLSSHLALAKILCSSCEYTPSHICDYIFRKRTIHCFKNVPRVKSIFKGNGQYMRNSYCLASELVFLLSLPHHQACYVKASMINLWMGDRNTLQLVTASWLQNLVASFTESLKAFHGHKGYGRFVRGRRWMSLCEEASGVRRGLVLSFGTKLTWEWESVAKCSDAVDSPSWTCKLIQSEHHQPLEWWPQHKQYRTNEKTVVF